MRNNKGIAMILSLIIILVLSVLGSALLFRAITESKRTEIFAAETHAFWLAEAGMAKAIWEINNGNWGDWTSQGNNKILYSSISGMGDFDAIVYDYANTTVRVEAIGYFPSRSSSSRIMRSFEVIISRTSTALFSRAAYAQTKMTVQNNARTDSYDSSLGDYGGQNVSSEGIVGSSNQVQLKNNAYVNGDVIIPEDGSEPNSKYYSGDVIEQNNPDLSLIQVPDSLAALPSSGTINSSTNITPGDYKYWMINPKKNNTVTITGPANIYLTGNTGINITQNNAQIKISAASTGPVNIYFDGKVNLKKKGLDNQTRTPENLVMYGTNQNQQVVLINSKEDFYGAIYAPAANITLAGKKAYYGSYIGNNVTVKNTARIHYDQQLGQTDEDEDTTSYTVSVWRDIQSDFDLSQ